MLPGDVIADRFAIEREAGSGGMGRVFLARDRIDGDAPVALKVLKEDIDPGSLGREAERFDREAQVLAELRHPHVVKYVAHGRTPAGEAWLAMEWLEGEDLGERLARLREGGPGKLGIDESIDLARRVGGALALVHARGVVHRDLKPSNLFLPRGELAAVKLLDFGVARAEAMATRLRTSSGVLLGTPAYMAPEQARGSHEVDARADVFSLGCVLFECLAGRAVFAGEHVMAILAKILFEEAPHVRELRPDVPPALDALVDRMLSKDPSARPRDGGAVVEAIDALPVTGASGVRSSVSPSVLTAGERRLVSVIVAEPAAVGVTDRTLTPAQLDVGLDRLRRVAAPFGARIESLASGVVVATLLAASNDATDQAVNAARCALAIRRAAPDLRVALATGRAILGDRVPFGEAIDRVARLLRSPSVERRAVDLDDVTAALLDGRFEVRALDRDRALLLDERDAPDESRTVLGKPTPCVGRDRELATLEATWSDAIEEHRAQAVLVLAPPGLGKSRLRHELVRRLAARARDQGAPYEVWIGRGDPMRAASPLGVLAHAIRRALPVAEPTPSALRARVAAIVAEKDVDRVASFLGEILGVRFPDDALLRAARVDPVVMADQTQRAFEDFLAASCARSPVLLVLEDLHHGDLPTLRFVDAALRNLADRPWMVLGLARPELKASHPNLWSGRAVTELRLGELSKRAAETLARRILGAAVPDDEIARIVAQAAGNPLVLEELARASAEGVQTPETVLAMLQARIERLEPETRRMLRAASVFGEVFWPGAVAQLVGDDRAAEIASRLRTCVERELVVVRDAGRFAGEVDHAFRHPLLREAAYATLTDDDRALAHRLAGAWLEEHGEHDGATLAIHFERGGAHDRASTWWLRAAEQALEANDLAAVVAHGDDGVRCGAHGETLGALRALQAEAHRWRGELALGEARSREALSLLPPRTARWYAALGELAAACDRQGRPDALTPIAAELLASTPSYAKRTLPTGNEGATADAPTLEWAYAFCCSRVAGLLLAAGRWADADALLAPLDAAVARGGVLDPIVAARVDGVRGQRAAIEGDVERYRSSLVHAAKLLADAGDVRRATHQRATAGHASLLLGDVARAIEMLRAALIDAERLALGGLAAFARHELGLALLRTGAVDEARAVELRAVEVFRAQGDRRMEGASRMYLALILEAAGEIDAAEREAREAVSLASVSPPVEAYARAVLAQILLARGRNEDALAEAARARTVLVSIGKIDEGESTIRLAYAKALARAGEEPAAKDAFREARSSLLARAARIGDERARAAFLRNVPENAETLELARE